MALYPMLGGGSKIKTLVVQGTSPFNAQTINFDMTNYMGVIVEFSNQMGHVVGSSFIEKGSNADCATGITVSGSTRGWWRNIQVNSNSVVVGNNTASDGGTLNTYGIPIIYAI